MLKMRWLLALALLGLVLGASANKKAAPVEAAEEDFEGASTSSSTSAKFYVIEGHLLPGSVPEGQAVPSSSLARVILYGNGGQQEVLATKDGFFHMYAIIAFLPRQSNLLMKLCTLQQRRSSRRLPSRGHLQLLVLPQGAPVACCSLSWQESCTCSLLLTRCVGWALDQVLVDGSSRQSGKNKAKVSSETQVRPTAVLQPLHQTS